MLAKSIGAHMRDIIKTTAHNHMTKKLYIANYIDDSYENNYLIFVSTDEANRLQDFLKMYESIQGEPYDEAKHNSIEIYPITEATDADGNEHTITIS